MVAIQGAPVLAAAQLPSLLPLLWTLLMPACLAQLLALCLCCRRRCAWPTATPPWSLTSASSSPSTRECLRNCVASWAQQQLQEQGDSSCACSRVMTCVHIPRRMLLAWAPLRLLGATLLAWRPCFTTCPSWFRALAPLPAPSRPLPNFHTALPSSPAPPQLQRVCEPARGEAGLRAAASQLQRAGAAGAGGRPAGAAGRGSRLWAVGRRGG